MLPSTQLGQAYYLMTNAAKLQYLLRIFHREGLFSTAGKGLRPHFLLFIH
jgi:hypothetical protein